MRFPLLQRGHRLVEPEATRAMDRDLQIQRERHAFAQHAARALGEIEHQRRAELVDALRRFDIRRADLEARLGRSLSLRLARGDDAQHRQQGGQCQPASSEAAQPDGPPC